MILIVMGVSGSGKSSTALRLSQEFGWPFEDGDDYHPPSNKAKMSSGIPLDDEDRFQWLLNLHHVIERWRRDQQHGILVCSALKHKYRQVLVFGPSAQYYNTSPAATIGQSKANVPVCSETEDTQRSAPGQSRSNSDVVAQQCVEEVDKRFCGNSAMEESAKKSQGKGEVENWQTAPTSPSCEIRPLQQRVLSGHSSSQDQSVQMQDAPKQQQMQIQQPSMSQPLDLLAMQEQRRPQQHQERPLQHDPEQLLRSDPLQTHPQNAVNREHAQDSTFASSELIQHHAHQQECIVQTQSSETPQSLKDQSQVSQSKVQHTQHCRRDQQVDHPDVFFVHLKGSFELISTRLSQRKGHFFNSKLLQSQFDTLKELQETENGIAVDIENSLDVVVSDIAAHISPFIS